MRFNSRADWLHEMGVRLKALRLESFPRALDLAERTGFPPSKISRAENGRIGLTPADVIIWCIACGADEAASTALVELAEHGEAMFERWRRQGREGLEAAQVSVTRLIEDSKRVVYFDPTLILGPLQTPAYAEGILRILVPEMPDIEAAVAAKARRWDALLYDTTKGLELLMDESVLHRFPTGPGMMRLQLERIRGLLGLPHARIGVIPQDRVLRIWPMNAFAVYEPAEGSPTVLIETFEGEDAHHGEVAEAYVAKWLPRLWADAVEDISELNVMIDRALADARGVA